MSGDYMPTGKAFGSILEYDESSDTYTVSTEGNKRVAGDSGRRIPGIPRKKSYPGEHVVLSASTAVIVDFTLGFPYIDGVLDKDAVARLEAPDVAPDFTAMDVGEGSTPTGTSGTFRSAMTPKGMLPGDVCLVNPDGSYLATKRGKFAQLYGSENAQVMCLGQHNLVRTICENFEHFSSFGELKIENKNGRHTLSLRGSADQLNEKGQPTFHLDIGDEGRIFSMKVTSPDASKTYAEIKISPDGYVEIFGEKGVNITGAGERRENIGGNVVRRIQGEKREWIGNNKTLNVAGDVTQAVQNVATTTVGVDSNKTIGRHDLKSVGGQQNITILGGTPADALPTNNAAELRCVNGSYVIMVGNPKDSAIPSAIPGYKVYVYNGAVILGSDPKQPGVVSTVSLNSLKPDSIGLGCVAPGPYAEAALNPPTDWAMLFLKWQTLMTQLITLLDSHTHTTTWGPSGPAMAPALAGFNTTVTPLMAAVKSLRVVMGA